MRIQLTHWTSQRRRSLLAFGVSALVHISALASLMAVRTEMPKVSRLAASDSTISIQLQFSPESQTPPATSQSGQEMVIMPQEARVAKRVWSVTSSDIESPATDTDTGAPEEHRPTVSPQEKVAFDAIDLPEPVDLQQPLVRQPSLASPTVIPTRATAVDLSGNVPPMYPMDAFRQGWEGTVLLRVWIRANGDVFKVEIAQSSGFAILDAAAANAVRKWKGRPAEVDGVVRETVEVLPIEFRLK
ncbi:MAG: TonB family protein [Pirellulaceae bacterium]